MIYHPGDTRRNRELLIALAAPPGLPREAWAAALISLAHDVHAGLCDTTSVGPGASVSYEQLLTWRNTLDTTLGALEVAHPDRWHELRAPGTWLDNMLRLRVVLTHVVSKAYWSGLTRVHLGSIEVERYLWGAR